LNESEIRGGARCETEAPRILLALNPGDAPHFKKTAAI